ncbi:hypothetical protein IKF04_02695 [Candidatus Saccharibacteria bacterium]|nr:hypothetical protein [Candidatus Saccharibacteria bacterium]
MAYAKSIKDFWIPNEFQLGEFKATDLLLKEYKLTPYLTKDFLSSFRLYRDDDGYAVETFFEDLPESDRLDKNEFCQTSNAICKPYYDEFDQIYEKLIEKGFIRTDGWEKSIGIASLFSGYCYADQEVAMVNEEGYPERISLSPSLYTTIKPMTRDALRSIIENIRTALSPLQHKYIAFHLNYQFEHDRDYYAYSQYEWELITKAIENIAETGYVKTTVNVALEYTMF